MAGKRRPAHEVLAEHKAKAAAIEAKLAHKAKLETDEFYSACDRALKALTKIVNSDGAATHARLVQRCNVARQALIAFLDGTEEVEPEP